MAETLLIDEDGEYDPRQLNDRLLLGLKGTMSEFELGLFRQRARVAFEQKVRRGFVLWELPVGFVRTDDDKIEKTPDRQVQQAIEGVFQKFRELGSARQTLLWYREQKLLLPVAQRGTGGKKSVWRLPTDHRIILILKNPCYAGAFAYGRTSTKTIIHEDGVRTSYPKRLPVGQWDVLILDHHPGYITWEQYLENQKTLEANQAMRSVNNSGAPKNGPALLTGLLRCGGCGRMLKVIYSGRRGRVARYACHGDRTGRGSAPCFSVGGFGLDQRIAEAVLEAIEPAGIEAALQARQLALQEGDQKRTALVLALERASYEADRAKRQYDAVEPENRLVAAELEARWNAALSSVAELESRVEGVKFEPLTPEQEQRLFELSTDLRSLWDHPQATLSLKKRILRTVLNEIIVGNAGDPPQLLLKLHWSGGIHTEIRLPRNKSGHNRRMTDRKVMDLIQELAKICSDKDIANILNRLGYRTGQGNTWRATRVKTLRYSHQIPGLTHRDGWLTLEKTANELNVAPTVIKRLIKEGTLPAKQVVRYAPWVIERGDLELPQVQAAIKALRKGRKLPRIPLGQAQLPLN
jgi:hypothetical protein